LWQNHPNRITGSDLYALSTLQISVPRAAGIGILNMERSRITKLLSQIPDAKLEELSAKDFEKHLGPESPARQLWDVLRRNNPGDIKWGVGPTTASKIMARKRPNLIPIQDSVVDGAIGRKNKDAWKLWWQTLGENKELIRRASAFRNYLTDLGAANPELSTLRVFDIV